MKVDVKSFAHLRLALGQSPMTVDVPDGSTVADLMGVLTNHFGEAVRTAIWTKDGQNLKVTPVVDGKAVDLQMALRDGMMVVFMSIVAAG